MKPLLAYASAFALSLLPISPDGRADAAPESAPVCYDFPIADEFLSQPNLVYSKGLYPDKSLWFGEITGYSLGESNSDSIELVVTARQFALARDYSKTELDSVKLDTGIDVLDSDLGSFAVYLNMKISNASEREKLIQSMRKDLNREPAYLAAFGNVKSIYRFEEVDYPLVQYDSISFGPDFKINVSEAGGPVRSQMPFGQDFFRGDRPALADACGRLARCSNRWDRSTALRCTADSHLRTSRSTFSFVDDFGRTIERRGFGGENLENAIDAIDELIALVPESPDAHYMKTEVLFGAGRYTEGVTSIQEALETYNQRWASESWISFSGQLSANGQLHELIRLSQTLADYFPDDPRYLANVAAAYGMLGDYANGLAWARRVYALNPTDYINTWNLGNFLENSGFPDDAGRYYGEALSASRGNYEHNRYQCLYADFLERHHGDSGRACELRGTYCTAEFDAKCLARE